ncbi:MAG: hypothetical protein CM15mP25_6350 [Gammaproteobacteria bacterium]|nr:MAG: hypothetical protein CM15mP25_6350 [Gammaproteobacteria bacterium]
MMVRHNGVAAPHNHIGGVDFRCSGAWVARRARRKGMARAWFYDPRVRADPQNPASRTTI